MDLRSSFTPMVVLLGLIVAGTADAQTCDGYNVLKQGSPPTVVSGSHTTTLPLTSIAGPWSISPTTVQGYEDYGFNFVTQDDKVHVIHYSSGTVPVTLDLKTDTGLPGTVVLYDAVAAQPVEVNGTNAKQAVLYVVGTHAVSMPEPYFWVLDQRAIFKNHEQQTTDPYILASGKLCPGAQSCTGVAGEVQVFSKTSHAKSQVAYVQMLAFTYPVEQRIMKISRSGSSTNFQVTLAQDLDPRSTDFPNLGFAFDRTSGTPYAAVAGTVMNLDDASENCQLGTYVTDLAIVTFDPLLYPEYEYQSYTVATVQEGPNSKLIGFPTGLCPDNLPANVKFEAPVPHKAIKVHVQMRTDNDGWVWVLSSDGTVSKFEISVNTNQGSDTIDASLLSSKSHGSGATDFSLKPTNLCLCEEPEDDQCWDTCFINEGGDVACHLVGPVIDPPPVRCLDPDDPGCDNTPVCQVCW